MTTSPKTRIMVPEDLADVLEMIRQLAHHHNDTPSLTAETLARDAMGPTPWATIIVAELNGALVGYVAMCPRLSLQFADRGMDMHHLYVEKALRGTGVGRHLINASLEYARTQGASFVTVGTHEANTEAQQVYAALGFTPLPAPGPRFEYRI